MWKASSPTATVYLAGSLHLGTKDLYPLPDAVEAAFAGSKILAVEVNIKTVDPTKAVTFMRDHGMYGAGDSLSKHLSKDTSDALDGFCTKYGFPRQMFEPLRPWAAGLLVAALPLQKEGASPEFGVDMHFLNEIKLPQRVDELETADFQLSMLSSGTDEPFVPIWETSSELLGESVFSLLRAVPCPTLRLASDEPRMMLTPRPVRFLVRVMRKTAYYGTREWSRRVTHHIVCV